MCSTGPASLLIGLRFSLQQYHNDLVGPIPSEFGEMTNLRNLGLTHNFLQGEIPSELGNLSRLKALELQHNAIRGKVPTELGRLVNLGTSRIRLFS